MKILAIADTHKLHGYLKLPPDLDMIIHAGDAATERVASINANEMLDFLFWFDSLPVKYKIYVPGNHDTSVYERLIDPRKYSTIDYLEHEYIERGGLKIFGSPWTPTYGSGWAWMKQRGKLDPYWRQIPEKLDILITHGPPKGILDLSFNRNDQLEYCGDKELLNRVLQKEPKFHIYGHIHDSSGNFNAGKRTISCSNTQFMNVSCIEDGRFDKGLTSNGIVFEI